MKTTVLLSLLLSFVLCLPLPSQNKIPNSSESTLAMPSKISYQGVLTDNNEVPQNGRFTMTFGLYTTPTEGSPIWSETQFRVQVTNGIFNVLLGSNTPINLAFNTTYYLGVSVQGIDLSPRIELASSGYSFNTARIQGVPVSSATPTTGQVLKYSVGQWAPGTDEFYTGGEGTVMEVNTGSGLTGGPITTSGTIGIQSGVVTRSHLANRSVTRHKLADNIITGEKDGENRVIFNNDELSIINETGVLLNLVATNGHVGIRFYKDFNFGNETETNPWHFGWIEGLGGYEGLAILRDWAFTAALWDGDGKLTVGRLDPHPPNNPPASARFEVRGTVNEVQAMVKASENQTADIFQVVNGEGKNNLSVESDGNIVVGSPDDPKGIMLYDTVDGSAYYLTVTNGSIEVTPVE